MNKNLVKRVANRHTNKVAKIETIDGSFKKVSPIIGTWLENVIMKLSSLENVLGYAEQIATKEHKRLEALVKKKYGYSDNFADEDYDDPLVQAFLWVDEFWGEVWTGRSRSENKFQKKIEEARYALEQTIYQVNSWRTYATRMASSDRVAMFNSKVSPNWENARHTLFHLFKVNRADYGHGGYIFHPPMPRMGWDKIKPQLPRLLKREGWEQKRSYEDQYEEELRFESDTSWIKIKLNKLNGKLTVSFDDHN